MYHLQNDTYPKFNYNQNAPYSSYTHNNIIYKHNIHINAICIHVRAFFPTIWKVSALINVDIDRTVRGEKNYVSFEEWFCISGKCGQRIKINE